MTLLGGGSASMTYDIDNRLVSWTGAPGTEKYRYLADNKRVWKKSSSGAETYYFYGVGGQKLATYSVVPSPFSPVGLQDNVYFGGKLVRADGVSVVHDRLGSVVYRHGTGSKDYFPYGDEIGTATAGNADKFGTYMRDATTGLDYADQRYFGGLQGRFLSADPYEASGGAAEPGSWGRYRYAAGDPIKRGDPHGLKDVDYLNGCGAPGTEPCLDDGYSSWGGGGGGNGCELPGLGNPLASVFEPALCGILFAPLSLLPPPDISPPSCNLRVASTGPPRNGQLWASEGQRAIPYGPSVNENGPCNTLGQQGLGPQFVGWGIALQFQGNLFQDTNPDNWTTSPSFLRDGAIQPNGTTAWTLVAFGSSPFANPSGSAVVRGPGFVDWLDSPVFPQVQEGGVVVSSAAVNNGIIASLTHISGASCMVQWTSTLQVVNGSEGFR